MKQEQKDGREVNGNEQEIIANDSVLPLETKPVGSPPKPKRTYEVEFVEQNKENVPEDNIDGLNVSEIIPDSSPQTSVKMNGNDTEPFTPVKSSDRNTLPQATSTPAPNGIISTGQGRRHSSGPQSKLTICYTKYFRFTLTHYQTTKF